MKATFFPNGFTMAFENETEGELYLPDAGTFDSYDTVDAGQFAGTSVGLLVDPDFEPNLYTHTDEPKFHIGQSYDKEPAKALKCTQCGGNQFYVGTGHCFTAIKCTTCEWEMCIHDG